jgi:hypothetical protein
LHLGAAETEQPLSLPIEFGLQDAAYLVGLGDAVNTKSVTGREIDAIALIAALVDPLRRERHNYDRIATVGAIA